MYLSFYWSEDDQNFREDLSKVFDHIQIKIKVPNPSQEPPASPKASNKDLKDMDAVWIFNIKLESQNPKYRCNKDQWPYPNQDQGAKHQSKASSILKSLEEDLKNIDVICIFKIKRELKFGRWVYQRRVTISESRSRCQTLVGNLKRPL